MNVWVTLFWCFLCLYYTQREDLCKDLRRPKFFLVNLQLLHMTQCDIHTVSGTGSGSDWLHGFCALRRRGEDGMYTFIEKDGRREIRWDSSGGQVSEWWGQTLTNFSVLRVEWKTIELSGAGDAAHNKMLLRYRFFHRTLFVRTIMQIIPEGVIYGGKCSFMLMRCWVICGVSKKGDKNMISDSWLMEHMRILSLDQ